MNEFLAGLTRWLIRAVLVVAGLVMFLSLLAAVLVLALAWALRALWARLTGRPVVPWTMRVDPRTGWSTVYRSSGRWSAARTAPAAETPMRRAPASETPTRRAGVLPGADEVVDVEPREPGGPGGSGDTRGLH
ncbi:hypothetical protein CBP36_14075 [Acidovorax carolinensis]|uniref:Uncharacterized protein n=1 Tax=Acidovorax carolinensis TaxID=553814 RepID=A0A240UFF8_9BURK|nr:hypothetical protein [Acidovorax carolinensis]ART54540.1 hypothetical protein CBP35_04855 [Acidovorax carolinensis]ART59803.1 hypothetical protein CBP36_14075 [Acidovorax carolinensis]